MADQIYSSMEQPGRCRICGKVEDLRMEACFGCADQVDGKLLSPGRHLLWDTKNPENSWIVEETVQ